MRRYFSKIFAENIDNFTNYFNRLYFLISRIFLTGGNTIRRVMSETGCHIHFPDSNRSNPTEKSNQVSIAGRK